MADPESSAADVLAAVPSYVWDGHTLPVPVEDIVDSSFGLHVHETGDLAAVAGAPAGVTVSGLLLVDAREIWVSAAEAAASPGRRRFTLGHELGHWCLHRSARATVYCRAAEEAGEAIEAEASAFAGALLFPTALVRAQWAATGGDLLAMRERFGGSAIATERAVFRAVHHPAVRDRDATVACFAYDDAPYDAWRSMYADGFIVNDSLTDPAAARLHRAACSFLSGPVRGRPRTAQPKWASLDLDELRRTFPEAQPCTRCRPVSPR